MERVGAQGRCGASLGDGPSDPRCAIGADMGDLGGALLTGACQMDCVSGRV
jgi:hypothetical protein